MTDQATPTRNRRVAATGGQVLGVAGVVVCIALAILVIFGRGWAVDQVNAVAANIDDALAKATPLLERVDERSAEVSAAMTAVAETASRVGEAAGTSSAAVQELSSRLSGLSDRYLPLRAAYADAHANVVSVIDRLQALDRLVPGISIPQGPIDALAALDERVRALDGAVMAILQANQGTGAVAEAARVVEERAADVAATITDLETLVGTTTARLEQARADVASAADSITAAITLLSLVIVLLLAYVAFLHVVLFRSAAAAKRAGRGG
jgi:hypothetical protein